MLVMSEIRINVRTTEEIKRNLEITARLRGMTVSALINSLAVKAIREEKQIEPEAFNARIEEIPAADVKIFPNRSRREKPNIEPTGKIGLADNKGEINTGKKPKTKTG